MLRKLMVPTLTATLLFAACDSGTTAPAAAAISDDYALLMFGESGSALENTMGPQMGPRPFDGRSRCRPLPDDIKLTEEQKAEIAALRVAFKTEHQTEIDALQAIFEAARTARQNGATRMEVHAILIQGREIAMAMRPDVQALHEATRAVLTDEQRAWLAENCRPRMPRPLVP